jgi:hypothetical protein
MNHYLNYYRENLMAKGDNRLFVSRYKVELPSEEELERFISGDLEKLKK